MHVLQKLVLQTPLGHGWRAATQGVAGRDVDCLHRDLSGTNIEISHSRQSLRSLPPVRNDKWGTEVNAFGFDAYTLEIGTAETGTACPVVPCPSASDVAA